ncbi:VOC family protein [Neorhizobium petrolearium]|uniref:VOC family protein n=1 Tax=Neorhizobium petrolearium TaxID=515361 RepID=A0ABY8M1I8_9HYPH|nr:VOC family protein [Neorhizobium petrolearium]MCC2613351.1 VOC family protein [Neorhizobium petrolearium]WGI68433.1 VOC family protein [Neorhizobium petrolearium]
MAIQKHKIVPHLWFEDNAEEAVNFYVSIFENSRVTDVSRYGEAGPRPKGSVLAMAFELEGQSFAAINGGPWARFNGAVSFLVHCETQKEIDCYYDKLVEGGQQQPCGWLTDRFGLVWQVNYARLPMMLTDRDAIRANRVMEAMMKMKKIDIARLEEAYEGKTATQSVPRSFRFA